MKYHNVHAAMRTTGLEIHVVVSGKMAASKKADVAIVASSRMYIFKCRQQERSTFSVLVAASAYGRAKLVSTLDPLRRAAMLRNGLRTQT